MIVQVKREIAGTSPATEAVARFSGGASRARPPLEAVYSIVERRTLGDVELEKVKIIVAGAIATPGEDVDSLRHVRLKTS